MPAFPASRVLGARASRSHGGRNALPSNTASRHARKKPTPLRERAGSGGILHAQEFVNSGSAIGIREFTARFLKTRLSVIDAMVGAVALARATPLCTFNTRHYKEFNLELCQPYFKVHTP